MLTRDDLVDLILRHLGAAAPGGGVARSRWEEPLFQGRRFLSEREIKSRLTPGSQHLKIPKSAILSPLAQDWLVLRGIKVTRE